MDVVDFSLQTIPVLSPYSSREAVIITLAHQGTFIITEAAPYPPYSPESTQDILQALKLGRMPKNTLPSLDFALSSATLPQIPLKVPLAGFFSASHALQQAKIAQALGITTAKLKIGSLSKENALALIKELQYDFDLRLDVNHQWSLDDLYFLEKHVERIAYIEDPYPDLAKLSQFSLPIALDFSYRENQTIPLHLPIKALIMKPTLDGGLQKLQTLQKVAQAHSCDLILGGCFESPIGIRNIALMHALCNPHGKPLGLGTIFYLQKPHPFVIENGYLSHHQ